MKIEHIQVKPKDFELSKPFVFASCTLTHLPYALIRLTTGDGITGYGECPAYWDPSGETQESTIGAIRLMSESIKGKNPFQIEAIMKNFDDYAYGAHAAKCGLDAALLDIQGKVLGVPIHDLLGGKNYDVRLNAVLPLTSVDEAVRRTEQAVEKGYRYIKVKVGKDLEREIGMLDALMPVLPSGTRLFVDANQGWGDYKTALRAIRKLEPYDLAWIEQPVKAQDWEGLKKLREAVDVPIMADESLYSYYDALAMAKDSVVDYFNIKLAKSGGMYLGGKIKAIADAANIPCVLGSMIESSLGMLANYHFASAYEMKTCGLTGWTLITNDFDLGLSMDGDTLKIDESRPGLGYKDESILEAEFSKK